MFRNLNAKLRRIAIALVAIYVFCKINEDKEESERESQGFQREEFDDIW